MITINHIVTIHYDHVTTHNDHTRHTHDHKRQTHVIIDGQSQGYWSHSLLKQDEDVTNQESFRERHHHVLNPIKNLCPPQWTRIHQLPVQRTLRTPQWKRQMFKLGRKT